MSSIISGYEFVMRGGFMMIPLLFSALIALTVIFERSYVFYRVYITSPQWISKILQKLKSQELKKAEDACHRMNTPVASVLLAGIEHFDNSIEEMELSMKNRAESWVPLLEKRLEWIDTVITAAPLMGLLGTITGMMSSFAVLSERGVNDPNAITGGVAEALIATATGLVIALVSLVAYNFLTTRMKLMIYEIELAASHLVEIRLSVHRHQSKNHGKG